MASPFSRRLAGTVSMIALCSLGVLAAAEEPAAPAKVMGDLWEVTTQMSMEGMPMALPAQKAKVCTQKDWTEPPGAGDERRKCTNSDFKQDGPKVTWKTVCAGPPQMTGDGEVTRDGADSYAGAIKFTSAEGSMTAKINGKRLGECELPKKK